MLPSLVSRDIEAGVRSYIKRDFPVSTKAFTDQNGRSLIETFLEREGTFTKGPWIEVKLPFRQAAEGAELPFTHLDRKLIEARPYQHQIKAFNRLAYVAPETTVIATGTGSGKTECFLYPVLDYCLSTQQKGIKAVLIYPMNALAADQSRRLAQSIDDIKKTTGRQLRAGLYTGDNATPVKNMSRDSLITDRYVLRADPPDILLTNYKMLDFLLMRPEDQPLWKDSDTGVLKYLVVDELHTFDGAQGTDLACLIRRLKDRLRIGDSLACVGTSATIGGPESIPQLCRYVSDVFDAEVTADAVITEERLNPAEFLESVSAGELEGVWPKQNIRYPAKNQGTAVYVNQAVGYWFPGLYLDFQGKDSADVSRVELARRLPNHPAFRRFIEDANGVTNIHELALRWSESVDELKDLPGTREERVALVEEMIDGLVALISEARNADENGNVYPFLHVRVQLWARELARAVATVGSNPKMLLAADAPSLDSLLAMPVVGCRECYRLAWAGVVKGKRSANVSVKPDLRLFYQSWFSGHQDTALFYPISSQEELDALRETRPDVDSFLFYLCPTCGLLDMVVPKDVGDLFSDKTCGCGGEDKVLVWCPDMTRTEKKDDGSQVTEFENRCPCCREHGSLRIFGSSAASIASEVTNQIHASRFNEDKKIIAFSDSVQDAAHRAGFMSARNYQSVVRHAIVHYLSGQRGAQRLAGVFRDLSGYWISRFEENHRNEPDAFRRQVLSHAEFLATFIPPDMQWRQAWRVFFAASLKGADEIFSTHAAWKELYQDVRERLTWELLVEFGLRANSGRTLLHSGVAAIYPDVPSLKRAASAFALHCREHFTDLKFNEEDAETFLFGLLDRMRNIGAFNPEDMDSSPNVRKDFGGFLKTGNDFMSFNRSMVLPTYGKVYRPPTGLTMVHRHRNSRFQNTILSGGGRTWCQDWFDKYVSEGSGYAQDFYQAAINELKKENLVRELLTGDNEPVWVLPLAQWYVTAEPLGTWRCESCGRHYHASASVADFMNGAHCMTMSCGGNLVQEARTEDSDDSFSKEPVRLNVHEHTALIDGDARKAIETSFGQGTEAWNVNLLSATPTLEMGIDIGRLSSVLQCSVPPTQANYLQRIGRAGRKDGNAFALTLAGRRLHDQYFWEDPEEMIIGSVNPPGVYLGAVSVLERQLVAYAIGKWVAALGDDAEIPSKLGDALDKGKGSKGKKSKFPDNFLAWVHERADVLATDFLNMMAVRENNVGEEIRALTPEGRESLKDFMTGRKDEKGENIRPSLAKRVSQMFNSVAARREEWQRQASEINKVLTKLRQKPQDKATDAEIEELVQKRHALRDMIAESIDRRNLFNFMTDEGLLPNYAFPEEGVEVESVIFNCAERGKKFDRNDDDATGRFKRFKFSRSISQAMSDLAPESRFYVRGHAMRIDQFRVSENNFEEWRLCKECSYAERIFPGQELTATCPNCGFDGFGDTGRQRKLFRVREIVAHADAREDRIGDGDETRSVQFLARKNLIYAAREDVRDAWGFDDPRFAFGFEFLKNVTLREINFGRYGAGGGETTPFKVANQDVPDSGYKICKECGMVHRKLRRNEKMHDFTCQYRDKPEPTDSKHKDYPWVNGLFLYREMVSEGIRIRVPANIDIDEEGATGKTNSLVAAIWVGLRNYFKGNVDHLAVTTQTEMSASTGEKSRGCYIVIYDTIPGGSGYLKDLNRLDSETGKPLNMLAMFRKAYEAISGCSCASNPEKDGCYRCVYQYRDSNLRDSISRRTAEKLLREIISLGPDRIELRESSIVDMRHSEESILEELFMKRLGTVPGVNLVYYPTADSRNAWQLTVKLDGEERKRMRELLGRDPGDAFTWQVYQQVDFGRKKDAYTSKPDFMFVPLNESLLAKRPDLQAYVFTDGWKYHYNILVDDTRKRQSIINSGARVWSVTWEDVQGPKKEKDKETDGLWCEKNLIGRGRKAQRDLLNIVGLNDSARVSAEQMLCDLTGNFDWLVEWLKAPISFTDRMQEAVKFWILTSQPVKGDDKKVSLYVPVLREDALPTKHLFYEGESKGNLSAPTWRWTMGEKDGFVGAIRINDADYDETAKNNQALHKRWAGFWQQANALQFVGRFVACTQSNEDDTVFLAGKTKPAAPIVVDPREALRKAWGDFVEGIAPESDDEEFFRHMLKWQEEFIRHDIPVPEDCGADGVEGHVFSEATGFVWNENVYLFAEEDLDRKEYDKVRQNLKSIVVVAGEDGWIEAIKKGIQG